MTVEQPPESPRETWDKLIAGGLSSIPGIGGVAGVGYQLVMEGPYNRRLHAWRLQITAAVNEIVERNDEAIDSEVLLDAFVNATRAAQATHQQDKLDALRNAVVNSVAPGAPDVDEQARFFRLVDQFSAAHLSLLAYLDGSGPAWDQSNVHDYAEAKIAKLLELIPSFRGQSDWYELLASDLADARLITQVSSLADATIAQLPLTTRLGERFLSFIRRRGDSPLGPRLNLHGIE